MKIGYVGLGKMGKNMVLRLLEQGVEVVAWNRSPERVEEVAAEGAEKAKTLTELVGALPKPRLVWLMLPAGEVVEEILGVLQPLLEQGDLVVDGGNSFYKDSQRRASGLQQKGIHFMDVGVSGGPLGAREGTCVMVGGKKEDYETMLPVIKAIAAPKAYAHVGEVGAGHFVKMVHNGIEYGMMEAIAEGAAVLRESGFKVDLAQVFGVYNHGSVIASRLVGWAAEAFEEDGSLGEISAKIGHTGEGEWTIEEARRLNVKVPVIETAYRVRVESERDVPDLAEGFRNKVVSVLREKFGQHKVRE